MCAIAMCWCHMTALRDVITKDEDVRTSTLACHEVEVLVNKQVV
jgi:hypothetical protein